MRRPLALLLAGLPLLGLVTAAAAGGAEPRPAAVARQIVGQFDSLFGGPHEGARAVHAKGILLEGRFVPAAGARSLTRAVHVQGPDVPVLVRFSDFAGIPTVPDNADGAVPKGMAIKFMLPDGGSTDIVAHSYDGFPAATPEEFLAFLRALSSGEAAFARHVASHPAARRFVEAPKPEPASFATESFYGVNAFRFTNAEGTQRFGKYVIVPEAGEAHLTADEAAAKDADYLMDDIADRLRAAPVRFALKVQLAGPGDSLVDGSLPWPKDRQTVTLGTIEISSVAADNAARQRDLLFTPLSLVGGIAPSDDPMLLARTRAYRISHDRRRQDISDTARAD